MKSSGFWLIWKDVITRSPGGELSGHPPWLGSRKIIPFQHFGQWDSRNYVTRDHGLLAQGMARGCDTDLARIFHDKMFNNLLNYIYVFVIIRLTETHLF